MRKLLTVLLLALVSLSAWGQKADLRRGNRAFRKGQYDQADIHYRKGLMKDTTSVAAHYNLANNLYRQEQYDQAAQQLDAVKETAPAAAFSADYYFNRGDVAIASEDWQTAVDAFMQCLLRTPDDLQAKENFIYARNKLIQQQQQQQQGGQDQQNQDQNQDQDQDQNKDQDQQNQDQNKDQNQNKDQDQNKDQNQDQQNQDQQDQNQNQDQQQQQQQQPVELNPQQAQQLLQAIQEKEKQTQEKVDEKKAAALRSRQKEKNW